MKRSVRLLIKTQALIAAAFWLSTGPVLAADGPYGVRGSVNSYLQAFTLMWEPVANASGYNVYRRRGLADAPVRINASLLTLPVFADRTDGRTSYYSVRAVGRDGQESADSALVDSSSDCNLIFTDPSTETTVILPNTISDLLCPFGNRLRVPLTVRVRSEAGAAGSIARDISIYLVRCDTGEEIEGAGFGTADVKIRVGYRGIEGAATAVAGAGLGGTGRASLYWHNGYGWIRTAGLSDTSTHAVDLKTAQLGRFQLRIEAASAAPSTGRASVYPDVITPNGDGFNDLAFFLLDNAAAEGDGSVFDRFGHRIAALRTVSIAGNATLAWDGRDESGAAVPSDLYLVRVQQSGRPQMLTVAVAR